MLRGPEETGGWAPDAFDSIRDAGWETTLPAAREPPPFNERYETNPLGPSVLGKDSADGSRSGRLMYNGLVRVGDNALFGASRNGLLLPSLSRVPDIEFGMFPATAFVPVVQRLFLNLPLIPGQAIWDGDGQRLVMRVPTIDPLSLRADEGMTPWMIHVVWEPFSQDSSLWFVRSKGADPVPPIIGSLPKAPNGNTRSIDQDPQQLIQGTDLQGMPDFDQQAVIGFQARGTMYQLALACERMLRITQEAFSSSRRVIAFTNRFPSNLDRTGWQPYVFVGRELGQTPLAVNSSDPETRTRASLASVYEEVDYRDYLDNESVFSAGPLPFAVYSNRFDEPAIKTDDGSTYPQGSAPDSSALREFIIQNYAQLPVQPYGVVRFAGSPVGEMWVLRAPSCKVFRRANNGVSIALQSLYPDGNTYAAYRQSVSVLEWLRSAYYCILYADPETGSPRVRRAYILLGDLFNNVAGNTYEAELPSFLLAQFARFYRQRGVLDEYVESCREAAQLVSEVWPNEIASRI